VNKPDVVAGNPTTVGRLTPYGIGCIIDALNMGGFKIVRA
jgi:hypothetical protein